ncbi:bifunctional oligoribonuclease/PAP phosphatase NrnA [Tomitella fengzijianii]|uniref:Bifunctional oligoribonuclease/PAP phosphatase NrnA n=1 Tax=Tomitella fengzijianii TaxID=2597660 RepID=A0A516X847_9ACTN|nr:bifunctional oligoribonuclease/PAP phosphatase NrnA [Tomitella fengzijianii]
MLRGAASVTVLSHINPDADTIGSALALALALERAGTPVRVSFPAPHQLPRSLRLLPGRHLLCPPEEVPADSEVAVAVDCSSSDRLGELAGVLDAAGTALVVDHHSTNTGFGDAAVVDPHAQSTTVIVERILRAWGAPVDADIAKCLYAGLVTDTGGLRRADTTSLRMTADLLETGFDGPELLRGLMDSHPFAWLPMLGTVLGRARLDPEAVGGRGMVHTAIHVEDARGVEWEEVESVIDIVRTSEEAEVAVVLKERASSAAAPRTRWSVSLRSRGSVDVAAVARSLGGGGHRAAAGYSAAGTHDDVLVELRAALGG